MNHLFGLALAALLGAGNDKPSPVALHEDKTLRIWFIDVEGGGGTLIVAPSGISVLVDSGWPGGRDAPRIAAVAKKAGLARIDHHVITHWHLDHFGGTQELSALLPIEKFYDHGPSVEGHDFESKFAWYVKLSQGKRKSLRPGDEIPLGSPGAKLTCVASHGETLGSNPIECKDHPALKPDDSDNARSVGLLLSFGNFRFLDCGDLTWNIEHKLTCPENKIGTVDVYQTNHHGLAISNSPALVHKIRPSVAVMNNGAKKGGEAGTFEVLKNCPGLEAWFQVHRKLDVDAAFQCPPERIANAEAVCTGESIFLEVEPSGQAYRVSVGSNGAPRRFETRKKE